MSVYQQSTSEWIASQAGAIGLTKNPGAPLRSVLLLKLGLGHVPTVDVADLLARIIDMGARPDQGDNPSE